MIRSKLRKETYPLSTKRIMVHLFRVETGGGADNSALLRHLSPEEREEVHQFVLPENREEFLWSRLFTRAVLGEAVDSNFSSLAFLKGPWGKPYLEEVLLEFNLSHSGGLIALATAPSAVGIDVEKIEDSDLEFPRWNLLARRHFSPLEHEYWLAGDVLSRKRNFYRIFTLKEAIVKALGVGLTQPLNQWSVPLPLSPRSRWDRWTCFQWAPLSGDFCLSLAVEDRENRLSGCPTVEWDTEALRDALNPGSPWEGAPQGL